MMEAADYTDEWFNTTGRIFRAYYVCLAGGTDYTCGTLILSDNWDRLHNDPLALKQRWYCNTCGAKYMTRYGVLCEMANKNSNIVGYNLAEHPPFELKDVKTMAIQERFKNLKTPQELYQALPKATPLDRGVFLKPTEKEGVYRFNVPMFRTIEKFEWDQLFNLPKTKKQQKAEANEAWEAAQKTSTSSLPAGDWVQWQEDQLKMAGSGSSSTSEVVAKVANLKVHEC